MDSKKRLTKTVLLVALVLAAMIYGVWLNFELPQSGVNTRDGILGVLLGLFICSQPAANFLDALLFSRFLSLGHSTLASDMLWWALNVLVLVVGWNIIFLGMLRFSAR